MRNISDKCGENKNTHFILHFFENRVVHGIKWKNMVERGRPQMTICRMRIACWIPMATNTHSEFVIFIAFLLEKMVAPAHLDSTLYVRCVSSVKPKTYVE